jgi:Resolvase, N terminal domain
LQAKEGTIESQVLSLKKQIAVAGNVLVREYIDDGFPGPLLSRPALDQLRKDIKTDQFDAVYFHDADRIAREVTIREWGLRARASRPAPSTSTRAFSDSRTAPRELLAGGKRPLARQQARTPRWDFPRLSESALPVT